MRIVSYWLSSIFIAFITHLSIARAPNIILIYTDDMGIGDVSYTQGKVRSTPNIDRMAREGKVFEQYYTNAPVCSPSRAAATTGMYPQRWAMNTFLSSMRHNDLCDQAHFLDPEAPSLARSLKKAGYKTAHIGKWHMGGGRDVIAPSIAEYGFDFIVSTWESPEPDPALTSSNWIWAPTDEVKRWERTGYFVDKTLEFLSEHQDQPCYINLWPDDPHTPWVGNEESQREDRKGYFELPNLLPVLGDIDVQMERLLSGIRALGLEEDTLVIFTSDNGPAPTFERVRTNQLRGAKNSLYEGGINMPFIMHWPGTIEPGQVDTVSQIAAFDLFPTLCAIAGAALPEEYTLDGQDFSASVLGRKPFKREGPLYWEYARFNPRMSIPKIEDEVSPVLAIRKDKWKCFTSLEGQGTELYDLEKDPYEANNLADQYPELAQKLTAQMLEWFGNTDQSEI